MEPETLTLIKTLTEEMLTKLLIEHDVQVSEQDGAVLVQVETSEPGILIGYHGRSLESLQMMLGQIVYKKLGNWIRITVSVGDYRERREAQLKEMAISAAERVLQNNEPVYLAELTPSERRIVHMALQEHEGVISESEGEGRNRRLVVKPKQEQPTA